MDRRPDASIELEALRRVIRSVHVSLTQSPDGDLYWECDRRSLIDNAAAYAITEAISG